MFPSCISPLQSAPRCVYILVLCLYHLRISILWYMTLLFQYVGMYVMEDLAALIPWEDIFMDYSEYRDSKLLLNIGTYISIDLMPYVQKTESFSSPLWRSQICVLLYSKHSKYGCVSANSTFGVSWTISIQAVCVANNSLLERKCGKISFMLTER